MKFSEIKSNFGNISFHKPTNNLSGSGIQISGTNDGKINIQIAKQITQTTRDGAATYGWSELDKSVKFMLDSNELIKVILLIRKALKGSAILFDQNKHNKFDKVKPFDNVSLFHTGYNSNKIILFLVKEFRNEIQLELSVSYKLKDKNIVLTFNFSKEEMMRLEMLFYFHQYKELQLPQGFYSCIVDETQEVIKCDFMPNLNKGDFIMLTTNGKKKNFEILKKTYVTNKNIIVYSI